MEISDADWKNLHCYPCFYGPCCLFSDSLPPSPPPPPPPPPPPRRDGTKVEYMVIGVCTIVASVFLLMLIIQPILKFYKRWKESRSERSEEVSREHFPDQENGQQEVESPIWYIRNIGLQQSVIECITVFKYKKDEKLIEGTECSVCLAEFEDDESLRLLPKCSHAFHIPCIDTWLSSHTNCPLCRAPVVSHPFISQLTVMQPSSSDSSGSTEDIPLENVEISIESGSQGGEDGTSSHGAINDSSEAMAIDQNVIDSKKGVPSHFVTNRDLRAVSSREDNMRILDEAMQPARRSVSANMSSASIVKIQIHADQ